MEAFLNKVNALKDCYSQYSYDDVMKLDKRAIQTLCLKQKLDLNEHLHSDKMTTRNIVLERLSILRDLNHQEKQQRLEFLNQTFSRK